MTLCLSNIANTIDTLANTPAVRNIMLYDANDGNDWAIPLIPNTD